MTLRPYALICALLAGVACSVLVACGSNGGKGLIAATNSEELNQHLDKLRSAVDAGHCTVAATALNQLATDVESLPSSVDRDLRSEIRKGYNELAGKAATECNAIKQQNATTAETAPTTAETEPTTAQTEPTVTEEQPPPDTTSADTTPTEPNGGVPPETSTSSTAPPGGVTTPDEGQGFGGNG